MTEATPASGQSAADSGAAQAGSNQAVSGESFTQADVDRIVSERIARERAKFADYDDLKTKAGQTQTLEQRLAQLETSSTQAEQRALRAEIASEFGISTKKGEKDSPSQADLFLTGSDEATLRAQAAALAELAASRKRTGNLAPKEGGTTSTGKSDPLREFSAQLFGEPV